MPQWNAPLMVLTARPCAVGSGCTYSAHLIGQAKVAPPYTLGPALSKVPGEGCQQGQGQSPPGTPKLRRSSGSSCSWLAPSGQWRPSRHQHPHTSHHLANKAEFGNSGDAILNSACSAACAPASDAATCAPADPPARSWSCHFLPAGRCSPATSPAGKPTIRPAGRYPGLSPSAPSGRTRSIPSPATRKYRRPDRASQHPSCE